MSGQGFNQAVFIGATISLVSNSDIRYEGILHAVDVDASTLSLKNVKSYGSEGRRKNGPQIPPNPDAYEFIIFKGSDIKDLQVLNDASEATQPPPTEQNSIYADPAVLSASQQYQQPPQQQQQAPPKPPPAQIAPTQRPPNAWGRPPPGIQQGQPRQQYDPPPPAGPPRYSRDQYQQDDHPPRRPPPGMNQDPVPRQRSPPPHDDSIFDSDDVSRNFTGAPGGPAPGRHHGHEISGRAPRGGYGGAPPPRGGGAPRGQGRNALPPRGGARGAWGADRPPIGRGPMPPQGPPQGGGQQKPVSYASALDDNYASIASRQHHPPVPRGGLAPRGHNPPPRESMPPSRGRGGGPPRGGTAGRGGGRVPTPPNVAVPNEDFDFQEAHEKFNKEQLEKELVEEKEVEDIQARYNPDDFFDEISCDMAERAAVQNKGRREDFRQKLADQRKLDVETFGGMAMTMNNPHLSFNRGRGGRGRSGPPRGGLPTRGRGGYQDTNRTAGRGRGYQKEHNHQQQPERRAPWGNPRGRDTRRPQHV